MTIGEFAKASHLSAKALRLYDDLGVLRPVEVDRETGYRLYDPSQLSRARLVAALREIGMPLAQIKAIVGRPSPEVARHVEEFWADVERQHADRRMLARYLAERMSGKEPMMFEVKTRMLPERSLLCLKRHVDGEEDAWALGKEFVGLLRQHQLPAIDGRAGASFSIYWGEVNDDGDGPIEWCRPVPSGDAAALGAGIPTLTLRVEPAHEEAFVELGPAGRLSPAQWQVVSESLRSWAEEHHRHPGDLGVRITYVATPPVTKSSVPTCDFAVPLQSIG